MGVSKWPVLGDMVAVVLLTGIKVKMIEAVFHFGSGLCPGSSAETAVMTNSPAWTASG